MADLPITRVDAFEVTLPIEAPIRHSYGVHRAFTRTLVQVWSGELCGWGETAAGAEAVRRAGAALIGLDAFDTGVHRMLISQRFYWSKEPLLVSALEMACLDLQGKATGLPGHRLLGGALRERIDLAAYCFYRYPGEHADAVTTPEQMADHAQDLVARFGFSTVKLKGGVQDPRIEMATVEALRERLGESVNLRFDPNAAWTPGTAVGWAPLLERARLEYYEDPSPLMSGMAEVRSRTRLPLATNMCVTSFDDLAPAVAMRAVDVVLSDPWYWGGPSQVQHLALQCHVLGLGLGMHSGIELGLGMAMMAHVGVTLPNLRYAVDAHYHHLLDDVVVGERLLPHDGSGAIAPPAGPGWGVELDLDKVERYRRVHDASAAENLYVTGSGDPDPWRPGWRPVMPSW
jgi:glucarate dehydratase